MAEPQARLLAAFDETLLSRVEDAGLNASAPPQQRWVDGWLVRLCAGKAQRARCINALAVGRVPLADKLAECAALYRGQGLPLIVRITPFTQPPELDAALAALGLVTHDETRVMVRTAPWARAHTALPDGLEWAAIAAGDYAEEVGALRGSPAAERAAHGGRLAHAPVPYRGFAIRRAAEPRAILACGQFAQEGDLAGLYDIATAGASRRQGLGTSLCERLLTLVKEAGASTAYLQVGAENEAARRIYRRLGFADAYSYHYRISRS